MTTVGTVPAIRQQTALATAPVHTIGELMAQATVVVKSGLAPDKMTAEQLAVVMLKGQEVGLRPLEAMESLYVVNGRVLNYTHQLVNLLLQAGHDYRVVENTAEQCKVIIYRSDGTEHEHTLTFKECVDAGWTGKATWKGAGQRTMMAYRAISGAIRLHCPEVVHQLPGRQAERMRAAPAPVDQAGTWYRYTRTLLTSNGLESVLSLVRSLAETAGDSPEMVDGIIDAEFYDAPLRYDADDEEDGDADIAAEAAVVTPPPAQGPPQRPQRPYPPELVKQAIASRAAKGSQEVTTQGMRGSTVGALEALFPSASKESKAHLRHQLGTYLVGKGTSSEWTHGECQALLQWAQTRQDDGAMVPTEMACLEAAAIILALDAKGQQELPL
jgi:hypothetical protein